MRVIGIDPGCGRNTGVCVLDGGKVTQIETTTAARAREILLEAYRDGVRNVAIEYSPSTHIYRRPRCSMGAMLKIAQNVAKNRAVAEQLIGYAEGIGYTVHQMVPRGTKMDAQWFKDETGWAGRTSSHARDAYVVASRVKYGIG